MHDEDEFEDALDYIYGLTALGWKPGLERFTALCERLGSPHRKLKCIHIGGTNGKGSTTAMVSSILKAAGYRVGTYYSPYVYNIRERVQLDLGMIGKEAFARHINAIRPHAASIGETEMGHPTEFEVKTALGLLYFVEQDVDFAVLEVGLGGRLDATNIVTPLASAITNVTLDHMDRLGNTIPEIAGEKAGIVKPGGHMVTAAVGEALDVIRRTCEERISALWHVRRLDASDFQFQILSAESDTQGSPTPSTGRPGGVGDGLHVSGVRNAYRDLKVGMVGDFQLANAATAIGVVEALQTKGMDVSEEAVRSGLESAYLPGRVEVLRRDPTLIIDGAHNLDGAQSLARVLRERFIYDRLILVMGMVGGHSVDNVVGTLAPLADSFYATAPDSPRATPAVKVAGVARQHCLDVQVVEPVNEAVLRALRSADENDLVCVTGSFYTISEVPRPSARPSSEV